MQNSNFKGLYAVLNILKSRFLQISASGSDGKYLEIHMHNTHIPFSLVGLWGRGTVSVLLSVVLVTLTVRVNINGQIVCEAGIVLKILESFYL